MIEIPSFAFSFKAYSEKNKSHFILPKLGNINEHGIFLTGELVSFYDILRMTYFSGYLIITFNNYPLLGKNTSKWKITKNNTLVLKSGMIKEIKRAYDIYKSKDATETRVCGHCENRIIWDKQLNTQYHYCNECHSISDKHGLLFSNGEQFDICPESGYYDRLNYRRKYEYFFFDKKLHWKTTKYYGGDNLSIEFFHKNILKNLMFLVGVPGTLFEYYKANKGHHPDFTDLAEANFASRCGELKEAADLYTKMQMRLPYFPALHYNLAIAYLQSNNKEYAKRYFQKSLEGCSNYEPTLKVLKYLAEKEQE